MFVLEESSFDAAGNAGPITE